MKKNVSALLIILLFQLTAIAQEPLVQLTKWVSQQTEEVSSDDIINFVNSRAAGDLSFGSSYLFNVGAGGTGVYDLDICVIDDSQFVLVYSDFTNSNKGTAIVGEINGTEISYGSEYIFEDYNSRSFSLDKINATQFVIAFHRTHQGGKVIIGTISNGNQLSFSSGDVFDSDADDIAVSHLTGNYLVIAFTNSNSSSPAGKGTALIGTISGGSTSFGTYYEYTDRESLINKLSILDNNHFVVAYKKQQGDGHCRIGTVSGNTIIFGDEYNINSGSNVHSIALNSLSSNKFAVTYQDQGNSFYGTSRIGVTSNVDEISYGAEYVFHSGGQTEYISSARLDEDSYIISYMGEPGDYLGESIFASVSGSVISYGNESIFYTGDTYQTVTGVLTDNRFVVAYENGENGSMDGYAVVGDIEGTTITWDGSTDTDWNTEANWDGNAIPTSSNSVIIPDVTNQPVIAYNETADCYDLTIQSGATLTLESTSSGSASLIVHGTATGDIEVQRYIEGSTVSTEGWHFLSSPVVDQNISTFHTAGSGDDFYSWDEVTAKWINRTSEGGGLNGGFETTFTEGKGYLMANRTTSTKTFTGVPNTSDIDLSGLSYTSTNDATGWHLIGNPFTSALYWNKSNWNCTNIDGTAKIWVESSASYTDISSETGIIPAMQGVFVCVNASTGSLTIDSDDRTHDSHNWYKSLETNKIELTVYDDDGGTSQESIIKVNQESTIGFDSKYDSRFLPGYAPQFYSVIDDGKLSTNTIPEITSSSVIPFSFVKKDSDNYYIVAEGVNSLEPNETVYLTDLKTNHTQVLNDNAFYEFNSEYGDDEARFVIHFTPLWIENTNCTIPIEILSHGTTVEIRSDKLINGIVNIYSLSGKLICKKQLLNQYTASLVIPDYKGLVLVSFLSPQWVETKKVIIW